MYQDLSDELSTTPVRFVSSWSRSSKVPVLKWSGVALKTPTEHSMINRPLYIKTQHTQLHLPWVHPTRQPRRTHHRTIPAYNQEEYTITPHNQEEHTITPTPPNTSGPIQYFISHSVPTLTHWLEAMFWWVQQPTAQNS